jgi:hypothetical protein
LRHLQAAIDYRALSGNPPSFTTYTHLILPFQMSAEPFSTI